MRPAALIILLALCATGCGETVDVDGLPSADGYTDWYRLDVTGNAPGHGNTFRSIYVNEIGRSYGHAGEYPEGTVMVKEIRALTADDGPGDLDYIAIMRRVGEDDREGGRVELDDGWLFTSVDEPGGAETRFDFCWAKCHVQAPVDGAWFDYGR